MITLEADFNHVDAHGRLRLEDLRMHEQTPFAEIAARHQPLIFVDGKDMVRGELILDPRLGWIGKVDWSTQDLWECYPPAVVSSRILRGNESHLEVQVQRHRAQARTAGC